MTTFTQHSSQTVVENSHLEIRTGHFGSMMDSQDHTFHIPQVGETQPVATSSMGGLSQLPEDDWDLLTQGLERLSLFGRTKAQVVLDPTLQPGSNSQFTEFVKLEDGEVPVVTLADIKGSKVKTPSPSYGFEDFVLPGHQNPTLVFESLPPSQDEVAELNLVHTTLDILSKEGELQNQQTILSQLPNLSHTTTGTFLGHPESVVPPDIASRQGVDDPTSLTISPVLLRLDTGIRNEQVPAPEGTTNPLLPQAALDLDEILSNSSVPYPFAQTPSRADLPFPLESSAQPSPPINQNSQGFDALLEQFQDIAHPWADQPYNHHDSSLSSSDWWLPPSLSPSYTDISSQDSTLYTPTSSRSPISASFVPSQSLATSIPSEHPLPTQDVLANYVDPAHLTLDKVQFKEPFSPPVVPEDRTSHRTTDRAAQVHEQIIIQVSPFPIGLPTSKPKTKGKGKGKAKAESDGDGDDGDEARSKESRKKAKRDEADKVRCDIEGCNGTFFSNWELKRHKKNLHGIGETQKAAVCHKCGRHFASGRKDSVDRHLELNACGKRNPRKSPKRFTTGQTS